MHTLIDNATTHMSGLLGRRHEDPHTVVVMTVYGERLDAALNAAGITQEELSERSGVSQGTISRIIAGDTQEPKTGTWFKLAAVFGLKPDQLASGAAPTKTRTQILADGPDEGMTSTMELTRQVFASADFDAPSRDEGDPYGSDAETVLRAVSAEHARGSWTDAEAERVKRLVRESYRSIDAHADLPDVVRGLYRAVRDLGVKASDAQIAIRYGTGKRDAIQQRADTARAVVDDDEGRAAFIAATGSDRPPEPVAVPAKKTSRGKDRR